MSESPNKLIERYSADNSAETKQVTYYGEIEDFTQFTVMTGLGDGIDAVAHHGFHQENFIPTVGITGLDVFSYAVMVHLAGLRQEKFEDRRKFLNDQNSAEYYDRLSRALYSAMTESERVELAKDFSSVAPNDDKASTLYNQYPEYLNKNTDKAVRVEGHHWFIIQLLKYNARVINPETPVLARGHLDKWHSIFEKCKSQKEFATVYYKDLYLEAFKNDQYYASLFVQDRSFDEYRKLFVWALLRKYSKHQLKISENDARYFIGSLIRLEKNHDDAKIRNLQLGLLGDYGVPKDDQEAALTDLKKFFDVYHKQQDKNDKAFYKANLRGIQQEEDFRTWFKTRLFGTVKYASIAGLGYSSGMFVISIVREVLNQAPLPFAQTVLPLFLVGATSLVDEASDLYFKVKKYQQSKRDLEAFEAKYNLTSGKNSYPGAVEALHQEHQDLKDRLARRETKLFQACCSFTGVFFGVLISWSVALLLIFTDMPGLITKLGFAGMGTIGMAAVAGGVMVKYQMGQNQKKIDHAEEKLELENKTLLTAYKGLIDYKPAESELDVERGPKPVYT